MITHPAHGEPGEALALNAMLGWTLFGTSADLAQALGQPVAKKINLIREAVFIPDSEAIQHPTKDAQLNDALERLWHQEQSLISPAKETAMSQEDVKAFHRLETETRLLNYEVPMLWRNPNVQLPNNYVQALKRLHLNVKRFLADREYHLMYKAVVEELMAKRFARRMTEAKVSAASPKRWFPTRTSQGSYVWLMMLLLSSKVLG